MCYLNNDEKHKVREVVADLMKVGLPFTGWEAAKLCVAEPPAGWAREVSAYVREMFNAGKMPGWASHQVVPEEGPLLFFPVPPFSVAGIYARRIRRKLRK